MIMVRWKRKFTYFDSSDCCYTQVFEDAKGSLVISFDCERAAAEGDLTCYMHHFAKLHPLLPRYGLRRDAQQWGITDDKSTSAYYVLLPPWV